MKGILLAEAGGQFLPVDYLEVPKPARKQILVKSLVTGINPVEEFMRAGFLVLSWPIVLGCDASGTVVEVGSEVTKFKVGDSVFGCTRLGAPGYSTFQEYFLMDENITFKKPENVSREQAATLGVGLLTACLGLVSGADVELKSTEGKVGEEWILVLGAAGSVGQFAVQIAKLCGFKVLGSCSPANDGFLKTVGADATFNYKLPLEEQLKEIASVTGGKFSRVFDASAMASQTGMEALAQHGDPKVEVKHFATTNDWVPIEPKQGIQINMVSLGKIGKTGDESILQVNQDIEDFIPTLEKYLADGSLKPMEYEVIGDVGVENILKGLEAFNSKKSATKKVLVRVAAE
ncbi:chaperonin 10-like protein [Leptodontidium sp. 2 PMI_412]|nr:chaperonin 10-like protein [Leptodontidium sp. MPI-SDFR-AT-0119]KAH9222437.1 chaperonin 10-like protein [Leptodontidium sp. 2 PMI_412]